MPWFPESHVLNMSVNCKIFWTRFWILLTRLRIYTRDTVSGKKRVFWSRVSSWICICCVMNFFNWQVSFFVEHKFHNMLYPNFDLRFELTQILEIKIEKKPSPHMHDEENNLIQFLWCVQIMENQKLKNPSSCHEHILWRNFSEFSECVQILEIGKLKKYFVWRTHMMKIYQQHIQKNTLENQEIQNFVWRTHA